mmetsp:Transcript_15514/g.44322  ORF Transcript_15514/g.44322 Transcript_15514/m.44322 type:complete len:307 (+) Transcript_15514:1259-2179(+)
MLADLLLNPGGLGGDDVQPRAQRRDLDAEPLAGLPEVLGHPQGPAPRGLVRAGHLLRERVHALPHAGDLGALRLQVLAVQAQVVPHDPLRPLHDHELPLLLLAVPVALPERRFHVERVLLVLHLLCGESSLDVQELRQHAVAAGGLLPLRHVLAHLRHGDDPLLVLVRQLARQRPRPGRQAGQLEAETLPVLVHLFSQRVRDALQRVRGVSLRVVGVPEVDLNLAEAVRGRGRLRSGLHQPHVPLHLDVQDGELLVLVADVGARVRELRLQPREARHLHGGEKENTRAGKAVVVAGDPSLPPKNAA